MNTEAFFGQEGKTGYVRKHTMRLAVNLNRDGIL